MALMEPGEGHTPQGNSNETASPQQQLPGATTSDETAADGGIGATASLDDDASVKKSKNTSSRPSNNLTTATSNNTPKQAHNRTPWLPTEQHKKKGGANKLHHRHRFYTVPIPAVPDATRAALRQAMQAPDQRPAIQRRRQELVTWQARAAEMRARLTQLQQDRQVAIQNVRREHATSIIPAALTEFENKMRAEFALKCREQDELWEKQVRDECLSQYATVSTGSDESSAATLAPNAASESETNASLEPLTGATTTDQGEDNETPVNAEETGEPAAKKARTDEQEGADTAVTKSDVDNSTKQIDEASKSTTDIGNPQGMDGLSAAATEEANVALTMVMAQHDTSKSAQLKEELKELEEQLQKHNEDRTNIIWLLKQAIKAEDKGKQYQKINPPAGASAASARVTSTGSIPPTTGTAHGPTAVPVAGAASTADITAWNSHAAAHPPVESSIASAAAARNPATDRGEKSDEPQDQPRIHASRQA
jgi:hypothetical protein